MKKHIPNAITCCNLISGAIAIIYATNALYNPQLLQWALFFIILGALFDFFDGMTARLLHVSSPIGKELDSLADVVTFGVAPSMMLFSWVGQMRLPFYIALTPLLMAAFSALRLAKFNLDERQTMGFIGLPTPANALFWGSFTSTWGLKPFILGFPQSAPIVIILMLLSCYLLVSEIPMFALKFKTWGWRGNEVKYLFVITSVPVLAFFNTAGIAIVIAWYVMLSAITHAQMANSVDTSCKTYLADTSEPTAPDEAPTQKEETADEPALSDQPASAEEDYQRYMPKQTS